jgi:MFS family permease
MNEADSVRRPVSMPLFAIQFLSWGGMFCLWIYAVPVITRFVFRAPQDSEAFRTALVTVSGCFAAYALFGACFAFALPRLIARFGGGSVYGVMLLIGAAGIAMLGVIDRPISLVVAFVMIGVGWSAMSNIPYAIASAAAPVGRGGQFMRIFGFSTVLPQIVVTLGLAAASRTMFGDALNQIMIAGGGMMACGGLIALAFRARLRVPVEQW